eukprot:scaffold241_cov120-Skeletonema_marinoi.AAC.11
MASLLTRRRRTAGTTGNKGEWHQISVPLGLIPEREEASLRTIYVQQLALSAPITSVAAFIER